MVLSIRHILCLFISILILTIFLSACGRLRRHERRLADAPAPTGLILEMEINHEIFGERLSQPFGIESDDLGNLFVVDAGNNRLIKFDSDLKPIREVGGFGQTEGLLSHPTYITLDNNLNLYVSDEGNQRVSIYDARLNYVDQIDLIDEDDPLKFGRPAGLAINDFGELLIVDIDNSRIAVFNNFGNFDRFLGDVDSYSGMILTPSCLGRDREGNIFVGDIGNSKLLSFNSYGIFVSDIGREDFARPSGIDFDRFGNIWVADTKLAALLCFDSRGKFLFSTRDPGEGGPYAFGQPRDLTMLPKNRMAISDAGENKLLIYRIIYPGK
jgi:sugar lactone lactonase YvrE